MSYTLYKTKDCLRCPGQGQINVAPKRTRKGHKKDTKFYITLDGFNSPRIELKYCLGCNICSIHKRVAPNAQGKGKSMLPQKGHKKDTKRTQKGQTFYIALNGFNSSRNELKYCLVCNICSIHKRIAPSAQGKGKSMLPQKGHKKDTNFYCPGGLQIREK